MTSWGKGMVLGFGYIIHRPHPFAEAKRYKILEPGIHVFFKPFNSINAEGIKNTWIPGSKKT